MADIERFFAAYVQAALFSSNDESDDTGGRPLDANYEPSDIARIREAVESVVEPLGHKVDAVVNYDNFMIRPDLVGDYTAMVEDLVARFYRDITRYTTSAFRRMKLGESLATRGLAPHVYESREEAKRGIERMKG